MKKCCYCKKQINDNEPDIVKVGRGFAHSSCRQSYFISLKSNVAAESGEEYVCFYCGKLVKKVDAVHVMAARYAHPECAEKYGTHDDEEIDAIYQTLNKYGVEYKYWVCESQRLKYLREGKTNKGIHMTLEYFYGVKHGDTSKAHGGIGIVPYVYEDAHVYYHEQQQEQRKIQQSLAQKEESKIVVRPIANQSPSKHKKQYNFEDFLQ